MQYPTKLLHMFFCLVRRDHEILATAGQNKVRVWPPYFIALRFLYCYVLYFERDILLTIIALKSRIAHGSLSRLKDGWWDVTAWDMRKGVHLLTLATVTNWIVSSLREGPVHSRWLLDCSDVEARKWWDVSHRPQWSAGALMPCSVRWGISWLQALLLVPMGLLSLRDLVRATLCAPSIQTFRLLARPSEDILPGPSQYDRQHMSRHCGGRSGCL